MASPTLKVDPDELVIMPLGAGREVGRSCIAMMYHGKTVLFDCGIHPARPNMGGLPFLDDIDVSQVDLLLISHFHIDHVAAVPWFLRQTTFQGKCYMTEQTKAISRILLADYVRVSSGKSLFTKLDLDECQDQITAVNYHQMTHHKGIKFTCYPAGHVLGACMWMVDIDGVRVLYTGDFSLEGERHLRGAEIPPIAPDVLIVESTHGITRTEPREEREYRFIECVKRIIQRGGRCLIPILALGRVQELLIILEEYWASHPEIQHVPIYYGSNLTHRSLTVYTNYLPAADSRTATGRRVFDFQFVKNIHSAEELDDSKPCVVLAAPAMLQSGMSRILFDRWASNPLNGLIISGYVNEGTLAKQLYNWPDEVVTLGGQTIPRRITLDNVSFSGHSDYTQTSRFVKELMVKRVVLVHGVHTEMDKLRNKLSAQFAEFQIDVRAPDNCEPTSFAFDTQVTADLAGQFADRSKRVSGLFIKKEDRFQIVAPEELSTFTDLRLLNLQKRHELVVARPLREFVNVIKEQFTDVSTPTDESIQIGGQISVTRRMKDNKVTIQWTADPRIDAIAENIALMLQCEATARDESDPFPAKLEKALKSNFCADAEYIEDMQMFEFDIGDVHVLIALDDRSSIGVEIECDHPVIKRQIANLARQIHDFCSPSPSTHGGMEDKL